jgi:hypothetical protein
MAEDNRTVVFQSSLEFLTVISVTTLRSLTSNPEITSGILQHHHVEDIRETVSS